MTRVVGLALGLATVLLGFVLAGYPKSPKDQIFYEAPGLGQLIVVTDPEAERVQAHLVYPAGEMSNPYAEGLAHYLEHLVADGLWTKKSGTDLRHSNAWTTLFTVGYWGEFERGDLASGLQSLLDTAAPLEIDAEFAQEERKIVLREFDFREGRGLVSEMYEEVQKALYQDAPGARSVIGVPQEIAAYAMPDTLDLHDRTHHLSQAALIVYGDIDGRDVERQLAKMGFAMPRADPILPVLALTDAFEKGRDEKTVSIEDENGPDLVFRKLVNVPDCERELACFAKINLLENLLDSGLPGGLAGPLRYDAFVAHSFSFDLSVVGPNVVEIAFQAKADANVTPQELLAVFEKELGAALTQSLNPESFARIKARKLDDWDVDEFDAKATWRSSLNAVQHGTPVVLEHDRKAAYEAVKIDDLQDLAQHLATDGRVVVRLIE